MSNACQATTREGRPCKAPPLAGRPYCFAHDPEKAEERREARRRGGERSRRPPIELVELGSAGAVREALERVLAETLVLGNSIRRNRAAGYLLGIVLRALEQGELEDRVERLEEILEDLNRR